MNESNIKILMIEDDIVDRTAFQRFVKNEKLQYHYKIASSVSEAKEILLNNDFDIVVSDFFLNDGDAIDILDIATNTPVIIVTGAGDEETAVKAMKKGAFDYLVKDSNRNYMYALTVRIENAIKYGMATSKMPLEILIRVSTKEDQLHIEVSNTGRWVTPDPATDSTSNGTGIGLHNLRQRLHHLYPSKYNFDVGEEDDRVVAHIFLND